ncbi:acidic endochitinase-like [Coffea arabica]|uniref:Acidic endochitinase-like n=1 Tax=Coffea arabica TaxID=13443 RepID=A0ABM4UHK1_COFAR
MAACLRPLFLAITPLLVISSLIRSSEGEGVGFYWGQSLHDENLAEMCNNSMYRYAVLASLNLGGNRPVLSIDDKCNPSYPAGCAYLGHMIDFCKGQGIKVLLSLGGRPDLSSDDAHNVAEYIWNNFLSNNSGPGPLNATVDGIDFRIQSGSNQSLDVLARALRNYSTPERKVYLSAAPLCQIPDYYLDDAIKTGVFDHVWVQFFGDPSRKFYPPIWIACCGGLQSGATSGDTRCFSGSPKENGGPYPDPLHFNLPHRSWRLARHVSLLEYDYGYVVGLVTEQVKDLD